MLYNFIVVDDNEYSLLLIEEIIKKFFKKKDIKYNIYLFKDYKKDFYEIMYTYMDNKVYLLDIEAPSANGVTIAEKIRSTDFVSTIMFVSAYEEDYMRQIFRSDSQYFTTISKRDLESSLVVKLEKLMKQNPSKILSIRVESNLYQIAENDIYYVKYENRKTIIAMKDCNLIINKQLNDMYNFLSKKFIYSHKACIVNMTKIIEYSLITKQIDFEDGMKTDLISRKYIKDLDDFYKIKD